MNVKKLIKQVPSEQLANSIVKGMQEKKAKDIKILDLRKVTNSVCDFFVVSHGTSNTHVDGIADSVEDFVRKELTEKPYHREGKENSEWVLLDYFNVVAHVFQEEKREFYKIEELWADAEVTAFENL